MEITGEGGQAGERMVGRYEVSIGSAKEGDPPSPLFHQLTLWKRKPGAASTATPFSLLNRLPGSPIRHVDYGEWSRIIDSGSDVVSDSPLVPPPDLANTWYWIQQPEALPFRPLVRALSKPSGILRLVAEALQKPSPPRLAQDLAPDGSSLPWLVESMQREHPRHFEDWLAHARSAIRGLRGIRVIDRPEDRHRYLMLQYEGGLEVPSWMTSEGTLRFLAITILAFPNFAPPTILLEEPENAIHPLNIEAMMAPLSSAFDRQILLSTHSPTLVSVASIEDLLVFERTTEEGTRIVRGTDHPSLKSWRGEPSLRTLYASGAFG
jgi:hypothetical protein